MGPAIRTLLLRPYSCASDHAHPGEAIISSECGSALGRASTYLRPIPGPGQEALRTRRSDSQVGSLTRQLERCVAYEMRLGVGARLGATYLFVGPGASRRYGPAAANGLRRTPPSSEGQPPRAMNRSIVGLRMVEHSVSRRPIRLGKIVFAGRRAGDACCAATRHRLHISIEFDHAVTPAQALGPAPDLPLP